jgi:hypothetical protein
MAYWWVNQGETYREELTGGYLWSPKTRADGGRAQAYINMTRIKTGDLIFSFHDSKIQALGIAIDVARSDSKPDFGNKGQHWSDIGWRVSVEYKYVQSPFAPLTFAEQISPLLPEKHSPLDKNLRGVQAYLFEISDQLGDLLLTLSSAIIPDVPVLSLSELTYDADEQEIISEISLAETVKATLVMARRGQGTFRNRVNLIEEHCRVTGVSAEKLLIASHIKPWKKSDNEERLNGNNGLFLSPHVDKLFNDGYISFENKGSMLISDRLPLDVLEKWSIDPTGNYGKFNQDQSFFLDHHRNYEFDSFQDKKSA